MSKIKITIDLVIDELEKGLTISSIAEKYGYSRNWIHAVVRFDPRYVRHKNLQKLKTSDKLEAKILQDYWILRDQCCTQVNAIKHLAKAYKISHQRIGKVLAA